MDLSHAIEDLHDVSWVLPPLAISGHRAVRAGALLACEFRIRRVVDLRAEACDDAARLATCGIALLHLPTPVRRPVSQHDLSLGVAWVREALARDERVLVHGEHGIGRSALLACCVLVSLGHSPLEALRLVKAARPGVAPSPDQLHALLRWAEAHRGVSRHGPAADTWDDLALVACADS
jgi:hypothetical protein